MWTAIIAIIVFAGVYTAIYQIYLYRQMRVSLSLVGEGNLSSEPAKNAPKKENPLRGLLGAFSFLARLKLVRSLAGASIPAKLVMAGNPITIVEFVILKVLSMAMFFALGTVFLKDIPPPLIFVSIILGIILPDLWLKAKVSSRHNEIRRDLPAVIDLLNLCVNAGLDFMLAVNRVVKEFKKCSLTDELTESWRETRMGASRREALQHLSRRVNLPELSSFVRTLLQADRMGSPMGEALKIQAEEIRMRRYFRAEEAALKAPIKLLFPLLFFILPAVLVIVAGPIFLQFARGGIKF